VPAMRFQPSKIIAIHVGRPMLLRREASLCGETSGEAR
jgi:hypothetical protein